MSMKEQVAPNKQNQAASIRDQLTGLMILDQIHEAARSVNDAYDAAIIGRMGFVQVVPTKEDKLSMVNLVGMVVASGHEARGVQGFRRLKPNGNCPRWFREAIMKEAENPTGMQFRVSVTGISHSGKVAFVSPRAKNYENAVKENERLKLDVKRAVERQEFHNDADIARKAYEMYAEEKNLFIDQNYKLPGDAVVMASYDSLPTVWIVSGGKEVATFIHGINKGTTTWEKEVKLNVVATKVDPFYNNLKKYLADHA